MGALLAQSASESARRREELCRRLYDSARARVQAGAASDIELHLAEVERGRLESDRIEAELAVTDARAELARLVGDVDELSTPLALPEAELPNDLLDRARRQRADLLALDEQKSALDAQIARFRREAIPSPTLFLDVATSQPGQIYYGGGIAVPIPIWQRNQGPIAVARAAKDAVGVERELLDREIALEVARAERTTRARQKEADLWRRTIVPAAEANLELIEQGWRAGKLDLFRVITAAREAGEARRTELDRLGAFWQSLIELNRATGTP